MILMMEMKEWGRFRRRKIVKKEKKQEKNLVSTLHVEIIK